MHLLQFSDATLVAQPRVCAHHGNHMLKSGLMCVSRSQSAERPCLGGLPLPSPWVIPGQAPEFWSLSYKSFPSHV